MHTKEYYDKLDRERKAEMERDLVAEKIVTKLISTPVPYTDNPPNCWTSLGKRLARTREAVKERCRKSGDWSEYRNY